MVKKLEFGIGWIKKILKKESVLMKKLGKLFLQKLPVSVWRVVKLFKVVIIPVLMMKTHARADENRNLFLQKITFCSKRTGFPFFI